MADQCKTGPELANQFNIEDKIASAGDRPVLVSFVSPWCEHCAEAKPMIDQAARELCGKAKVLQVDATLSPKLMDRYDVDGFPTVIMLQNGQVIRRLDGVESKKEVLDLVLGRGGKGKK